MSGYHIILDGGGNYARASELLDKAHRGEHLWECFIVRHQLPVRRLIARYQIMLREIQSATGQPIKSYKDAAGNWVIGIDTIVKELFLGDGDRSTTKLEAPELMELIYSVEAWALDMEIELSAHKVAWPLPESKR